MSQSVQFLVVACQKLMLTVTYQPPYGRMNSFHAYLEEILNYANEHTLTPILGGDFKVDMFNSSSTQHNFETVFTNMVSLTLSKHLLA